MIRAGKTFIVSLAASAFILSYVSGASAETFYRWNDDRGNPVHSDRPPPEGIKYEVVSTDSQQIRAVEADKGAVPKKVTPSVSNDFQPIEPKKLATEKNPEYCARARENLNTIDVAPRIRTRNDQGEMRILTPEERSIERQRALDAIETYCE